MINKQFIFVGYLVQEPYLKSIVFPEMHLAILNRRIHPRRESNRYEEVGGISNLTTFDTHIPEMSLYPGWIINGYAIDAEAVRPELGLDGTTWFPSKYEYAKHLIHTNDGLQVIGYDLVDEKCHPMSLLHNLDNSLEEIETNGGELNQYGLFASVDNASRFAAYLENVNQSEATIWQIWG